MSDRIELSGHSWIESGYLHTTNCEIAFVWETRISTNAFVEVFGNWDSDSGFGWNPMGYMQDLGVQWRIPISELEAIYGYRDGEPWCRTSVDPQSPMGNVIASYPDWYGPEQIRRERAIVLHLNAVILCAGSAESLRKLWEVIKEVEG